MAEHRARRRHAPRPLRADRARPRAGRLVGGPGEAPEHQWHAADAPSSVRRAAGRRLGRDHRTDLLPRSHAGSPGGRARLTHVHLHSPHRSEEHTSELQSLMRISYAVFCLTKKTISITHNLDSTPI